MYPFHKYMSLHQTFFEHNYFMFSNEESNKMVKNTFLSKYFFTISILILTALFSTLMFLLLTSSKIYSINSCHIINLLSLPNRAQNMHEPTVLGRIVSYYGLHKPFSESLWKFLRICLWWIQEYVHLKARSKPIK